MIEGCRAWQDRGLEPPLKIREAVTSYFDGEDFVSDWIAEDCELGAEYRATAAELYPSWRRRAEALGIEPGNARDLGERLRALGYEPFRTGRGARVEGYSPLAVRRRCGMKPLHSRQISRLERLAESCKLLAVRQGLRIRQIVAGRKSVGDSDR